MNAPLEPAIALQQTEFTLNGAAVAAEPGETIIEAAQRHGVEIPHLCYTPGMRPDGNCRACMVEIKGERVLAPSCCRFPTQGMEVASNSARALHAQKIVVEMLVADVPERVYKRDSELERWRQWLGIGRPRFEPRAQPAAPPKPAPGQPPAPPPSPPPPAPSSSAPPAAAAPPCQSPSPWRWSPAGRSR